MTTREVDLSSRIDDLARWMSERRWFATKNTAIDSLEILSQESVQVGAREVVYALVRVSSGAREDTYQLFVTAADPEYVHANVDPNSIISTDGRSIYELFGDNKSLSQLALLFNSEWSGAHLSFHSRHSLEQISSARLVSSEQSNSSVILGDEGIAKFYRRITLGLNPDLEVGLALDNVNCSFVPRLYGWAQALISGESTTIAVLQQFFPLAVDGFEHAVTSVRDLMADDLQPREAGGDFSAEARRLGEAVRAVHGDLVRAFGTTSLPVEELIRSMRDRLAAAVSEVPLLLEYAQDIEARYSTYRAEDISAQRIHGDLHLGQTLRDPSGWKILDFEGEPGAPLSERTAFGSSLRDIAGMLRSFDYASRQPLINHPDQENLLPRTAAWADRNRAAFMEGYGTIADLELLTLFELDKAIYEVLYEHRFRPDWIEVPLGGIARLMEVR